MYSQVLIDKIHCGRRAANDHNPWPIGRRSADWFRARADHFLQKLKCSDKIGFETSFGYFDQKRNWHEDGLQTVYSTRNNADVSYLKYRLN